jgi:hypothetical protein
LVSTSAELPTRIRRWRTERAHRTSLKGANLRAHIGTYALVVLDTHIAGYVR